MAGCLASSESRSVFAHTDSHVQMQSLIIALGNECKGCLVTVVTLTVDFISLVLKYCEDCTHGFLEFCSHVGRRQMHHRQRQYDEGQQYSRYAV